MKKLYNSFFLLIISFFLTNCSDSSVDEKYNASTSNKLLAVSLSEITFSEKGESKSIIVNARETPWRFVEYPAWLIINPVRGNGTTDVVLTAEANISADTIRTSIFYLESSDTRWNYRVNISVSQNKAEAYITPFPDSVVFGAGSSSKEIKVSSNTEWEVKNNETWLTISRVGDVLIISVSENTTNQARSSAIQLYGSNTTSTINVKQEAGGFSCSVDKLEFEQSESMREITINSEISWYANPSHEWIHISPANGSSGKHNLKITVDENPSTAERHGIIIFKIASNTLSELPITQMGRFIDTDISRLEFSPNKESKSISITSNVNWIVNNVTAWATVSEEKGSGNGVLAIIVQENKSSDSREGKIRIASEDGSLSKDIQLFQNGIIISIESSTLEFDNNGGNKNIYIQCNTEWHLEASVSWLSFDKTSGMGDATLTVTAKQNTETSSRTGSIKISCGNITKSIVVNQHPKPTFSLSTSSLNYTSSSESKSLKVTTNQNWTANTDVNWIDLSQTSGSGDATITVSVKENSFTSSRTGTITFTPKNGSTCRVAITQEGAAMFVSATPNKLSFTAAGGTQTVNIKSNYPWKATSDVSWLSLSSTSGSDNATLEITVNANMSTSLRNGQITFKAENATSIVSVGQEGRTYPGGHEYADLGLPSGTLWATCNVGASSPEEYGNYYAWGETTPKEAYLWSNLNYCYNANGNSFYKYNTNSRYGTVDNKIALEPSDDAAYINWGDGWIMPTDSEWTELRENCAWVWTSQNGVNGFKAISKKNSSTLFFPAAGYYSGTRLASKGDCGFYWSSSLNGDSPQFAWSVPMGSTMVGSLPPSVGRGSHVRCDGISVRPVYHP